MIWFFTPYAHDKKLLDAIDRCFNLVPNSNDWVVLMDGDTAFLRSDFGHVIKRYTEAYPQTGLFTCYASRCHYQTQVPTGINMDFDSILYHRQIATYHAENFKDQVLNLNTRIAGHFMVIRKGTWLRLRGDIYSRAINKYIQGVDTRISYAILDAELTIRLMRELYIFHYLRLAEGFSLRGLEKNGINVGRIFIVGELPAFLSEKVIHIPAVDVFNPSVNADGNIAHKLLISCADKRLSTDFLFINDDHVILKPVGLKQIPSFHKGDMNSFPDKYSTVSFPCVPVSKPPKSRTARSKFYSGSTAIAIVRRASSSSKNTCTA